VGQSSRWGVSDSASTRYQEIFRGVISLLERHSDLIKACEPRTRFNRCGYLLREVLTRDHVDFVRLLVGSEGTLAIFTGATLRIIPLAQGRSLVLLGFTGFDAAIEASQKILTTKPTSCELVDRRLMTLTRELGAGIKEIIPEAAEVVIVTEYES